MRRKYLVNTVLENCNDDYASRRLVNNIVESTFKVIISELKKQGKVTFSSFGTFKVSNRKARDGRHPKTGEPIKLKAGKTVRFQPAQGLKEALNRKPQWKKSSKHLVGQGDKLEALYLAKEDE
jgi:DNA-binding protein HU-beta